MHYKRTHHVLTHADAPDATPGCGKGASPRARGAATAPVLSWGWARPLFSPRKRGEKVLRPRSPPLALRFSPLPTAATRREPTPTADSLGGGRSAPAGGALCRARPQPPPPPPHSCARGGREVSGGRRRRGRVGGGGTWRRLLARLHPRRGCVWRPGKGGLLPWGALHCQAAPSLASPLPPPRPLAPLAHSPRSPTLRPR